MGIWCQNDVVSTSMRRNHVVMTSMRRNHVVSTSMFIRRHFYVMYPLGSFYLGKAKTGQPCMVICFKTIIPCSIAHFLPTRNRYMASGEISTIFLQVLLAIIDYDFRRQNDASHSCWEYQSNFSNRSQRVIRDVGEKMCLKNTTEFQLSKQNRTKLYYL